METIYLIGGILAYLIMAILFLSQKLMADEIERLNARLDLLAWADRRASAPLPSPVADLPEPPTEYAMCGGCGKSVPLTDGFNVAEHGCEMIESALLAK